MPTNRVISFFSLIFISVFFISLLTAFECSGGNRIPKIDSWINDTANVLSASDRKRLSDALSRYHQETHHQIVVLTVPTLSGESIESFSLKVAKTYRIGYKSLNNGILVTVAIKERKIRIELGKGMTRYISNSSAESIISNSMAPSFAKDDYAGGLERGIDRLMNEARRFVVSDNDLPSKESAPTGRSF